MLEAATVAPDGRPPRDDVGGPDRRARLQVLDRERAGLLVRLHRRPDDVAATVELQAVSAESGELRAHADTHQRDALVRGGLSGNEVIRRWVRSRLGRRNVR